jgi:hypothetical protein
MHLLYIADQNRSEFVQHIHESTGYGNYFFVQNSNEAFSLLPSLPHEEDLSADGIVLVGKQVKTKKNELQLPFKRVDDYERFIELGRKEGLKIAAVLNGSAEESQRRYRESLPSLDSEIYVINQYGMKKKDIGELISAFFNRSN